MWFLFLETLPILLSTPKTPKPLRYFETRFLEEADEFLSKLDSKAIKKVLYNIDLAEQTNDPRLLKKLQSSALLG
jgi:hypothetical protein